MGLINYLPQILISHRISYVNSYCSPAERTHTLQCISGCSGSVILAANCTRNSSSENWADFEGVTTFDITDPTPTTLELMFVFVVFAFSQCNAIILNFKWRGFYVTTVVCLSVNILLTSLSCHKKIVFILVNKLFVKGERSILRSL